MFVLLLPVKLIQYIMVPDVFVVEQRAMAHVGFLALHRAKNMPMQWRAALSSFVLTRMAELVKDGLNLDVGIKDKSLDKICKDVRLSAAPQ